jgi:hypothetical protein
MNIGTILKVLGVKITPEQVAQLETVLPQIPQRAVEVIRYVNQTAADVAVRLEALERSAEMTRSVVNGMAETLERIEMRLDTDDTKVYPAGTGAMQRLLEEGRTDLLPSRLEEQQNNVNGFSGVGGESNAAD